MDFSEQDGSNDIHNTIVMSYTRCHKMTENGKNSVFWHFMTSCIWQKVSLTITIWVSLEPYCSQQSTHRFKILKNTRKPHEIFKMWFLLFSLYMAIYKNRLPGLGERDMVGHWNSFCFQLSHNDEGLGGENINFWNFGFFKTP